LKINNQHQIKQNNRKLFRQISAFICVHLRLIFVSLRDIPQEIQFKLFPIINENGFVPGCQKINESAFDYQTHSCLNLLENEPQIMASRVTPLEGVSTYALRGIGVRGVENPQGFGIDERRFVNMNIQHLSEVYPINGLPKSPQCMQRPQSSKIAVVTCERAAQSRLRTQMTRIARIFTDLFAMQEKTVAFYYALLNKANTILYHKSDLNDRHLLLQRA